MIHHDSSVKYLATDVMTILNDSEPWLMIGAEPSYNLLVLMSWFSDVWMGFLAGEAGAGGSRDRVTDRMDHVTIYLCTIIWFWLISVSWLLIIVSIYPIA